VSIVQNQTRSLESDVETTHQVLDQLDGPAVLVGHSYGGVVITEAGRHERVAGLACIAAFAPDAGESVNTLIADPPPGAPVPPIPSAGRPSPAGLTGCWCSHTRDSDGRDQRPDRRRLTDSPRRHQERRP
jgi:pimeloyl-ACP methyl ester carboxylesterase